MAVPYRTVDRGNECRTRGNDMVHPYSIGCRRLTWQYVRHICWRITTKNHFLGLPPKYLRLTFCWITHDSGLHICTSRILTAYHTYGLFTHYTFDPLNIFELLAMISLMTLPVLWLSILFRASRPTSCLFIFPHISLICFLEFLIWWLYNLD